MAWCCAFAGAELTATDFVDLAKKIVDIGTSSSRISTTIRRWTFRWKPLRVTFPGSLTRVKFAKGYEQCVKEAQRAYDHAIPGGNE